VEAPGLIPVRDIPTTIPNDITMATKQPVPEFSQYGLKDEDGHSGPVYANRAGGEQPGVGPADAVDASGHRLGKIEKHPQQKPSSRMGRAEIGETDNKKR
jgi:hypothetical protein